MEKQDLIAGSTLIIKDLQLEPDSLLIEDELNYEALIHRLSQVLDHLISKDFNQLLNVLYRIDVSEEKLKEALATKPENTSTIIAKMILERELQKVATRKKYSN